MVESNGSGKRSSSSWRSQLDLSTGSNREHSVAPASKKRSGFKIAGYVRISPSDEERGEGSLVSHPQRIEHFVKMKLMSDPAFGVIADWYVDREMSGKDMNRPSFIRMCQDIRDGRINAIVVTELSRLSRSVKDFTQFKEFLDQHKVKLFSLKENFDTSTPMGELMLVQAISFAQFERQSIVSRIKEGAKARAERGLSNGGQRPLGYDPDPIKRCHLVVNETEAPLVQHIFDKSLELGTLTKLYDYLLGSGYQTKEYTTKEGRTRGGKRWSITSLHALLTNFAYIGKREINKRHRGANPEMIPEGEEYRLVSAHWPAIIKDDVFFAVQERMESNKKRTRKYIHRYRLSGLVHCGVCGAKLVGKSAHGRRGKYFYYSHMRKVLSEGNRHEMTCIQESISAVPLEEAIIARLDRLSQDRQLLAALIKSSKGNSEEEIERTEKLILSKIGEKSALKGKLASITSILSENINSASKHLVVTQLNDEANRLRGIEQEIETLKNTRASLSSNVVHLGDAFELMRIFRERFSSRSADEQADVLKDFIHRVVVYADKTAIEYYMSSEREFVPVGMEQSGERSGENSKSLWNPLTTAAEQRSGVRSLYDLVETWGVEPQTYSLQSYRSTN